MITRSWKTTLFLVTLVAAPYLPAFSFHTSHPVSVKISLPVESLDLSDLDVRDEFNRPVKNISQRRALEQLFVTNLNRMLMWNLTQTTQNALALLTQKWNVFAGLLKRQVNRLNEKVLTWLDGKRHKFKVIMQAIIPQAHRPTEFSKHWSWSHPSFTALVSHLLSSTRLLL